MPRKGRSVRIARGIFRDDSGHRVQASFRGKKKERRFPLNASLRAMRDWQDQQRGKMRKGRVIFDGAVGSLNDDVKRYLRLTKHLVSWKSRRSELHAWAALYGKHDRTDIGHEEVRLAIGRWTEDGVAPKTIRNRLVALSSLYRLLDVEPGQRRPMTPVDGITVPVPKKRPTYVSVTIVQRVEMNLRAQQAAGRLRDGKTRGRFMVMAATGVRPSQLVRVQPQDVDVARRTWNVAGAKGGEPITFWLNEDMLTAWKVFIAADAWGRYDTRSMARTLRTAGWPVGVRPYNVRHAVGQDLSERGEDFQDIADWLGHSDVETTRRYYVPVLTSRLRAMSERIDGRLGWESVPQTVPQKTGLHRPKASDSGRNVTRPVQTKRAVSRKKTAR